VEILYLQVSPLRWFILTQKRGEKAIRPPRLAQDLEEGDDGEIHFCLQSHWMGAYGCKARYLMKALRWLWNGA